MRPVPGAFFSASLVLEKPFGDEIVYRPPRQGIVTLRFRDQKAAELLPGNRFPSPVPCPAKPFDQILGKKTINELGAKISGDEEIFFGVLAPV